MNIVVTRVNNGTSGTNLYVPEPKNLRIVLPAGLVDRWESMLSEKSISQQDAIVGLVTTVLEQDDDVQSMLLRQMKPRDDLIETVLRRLQEKRVKEPARKIVSKGLSQPVR
jgi:hypothetical protein